MIYNKNIRKAVLLFYTAALFSCSSKQEEMTKTVTVSDRPLYWCFAAYSTEEHNKIGDFTTLDGGSISVAVLNIMDEMPYGEGEKITEGRVDSIKVSTQVSGQHLLQITEPKLIGEINKYLDEQYGFTERTIQVSVSKESSVAPAMVDPPESFYFMKPSKTVADIYVSFVSESGQEVVLSSKAKVNAPKYRKYILNTDLQLVDVIPATGITIEEYVKCLPILNGCLVFSFPSWVISAETSGYFSFKYTFSDGSFISNHSDMVKLFPQ